MRWVRCSPPYVPQFLPLQNKPVTPAQLPEAEPAHTVLGDPGALGDPGTAGTTAEAHRGQMLMETWSEASPKPTWL